MYPKQYKSGLYNEPYNLKLNLTYKQTQDSVLQNIHCHDVMLSFAKQCTLHSSIVENTFHFVKLSCKLGQVFLAMIYRFLWQVVLSTLAMLRKHGTVGILNAICMFTSEFQFAFTRL